MLNLELKLEKYLIIEDMIQTLILDWLPTDMNTYIAAEKRNRYVGGKIKKEETDHIYYCCLEQRLQPMKSPVKMTYNWTAKNRKKDKSNIVGFARKVIEDGLVNAGVLSNDGWNDIDSFSDTFALIEGDNKEGVSVTIEEV